MAAKIPKPPAPPSRYKASSRKPIALGLLKAVKKSKPNKKIAKKKITKTTIKEQKPVAKSLVKPKDVKPIVAEARIKKLEDEVDNLTKSLSSVKNLNHKLSDMRSLFTRIRDLERLAAEYKKDEDEINKQLEMFSKKLGSISTIRNKTKMLGHIGEEVAEIADLNVEFDKKLKKIDKEMELFFKALRDTGKQRNELELLRSQVDNLNKTIHIMNSNMLEMANKLKMAEKTAERTIIIE